MLWARIAFRATVFRKVDLPEALEPVSSIGRAQGVGHRMGQQRMHHPLRPQERRFLRVKGQRRVAIPGGRLAVRGDGDGGVQAADIFMDDGHLTS